jgi:hypothetical protein
MANIQKSLGRINVVDLDELYKDDSTEKGEWSDISEDALKSMFIPPEPDDEPDPRMCYDKYGISPDWYAEKWDGFPDEYYRILSSLHTKVLDESMNVSSTEHV